MLYNKGDIKHFYTHYINGDMGYVKLECFKDSDSEISSLWKVYKDTIVGEITDKVIGTVISANELNGVGLGGIGKYLHDTEEQILKEFFFNYHEYDF